MFQAFFGEFTTGRLARLPLLGFWLLLTVLFLLFGLGIAFGIGLAEPLLFEGPAAAQTFLVETVSLPVIILVGLFCLVFLVAKLNLLAKRIRDMGLPGWGLVLAITLVSAVLLYLMPYSTDPLTLGNQVNGAWNGLLLLALLLIPSGTFGSRAASPPPEALPPAMSAAVSEAPPTDESVLRGSGL